MSAPEVHTTGVFAAGSFEFTVVASHRDDQAVIEQLFRDLALHSTGATEPFVFSLTRGRSSRPTWIIDGPRVEDQPELPFAAMLTRLMSAINVCVLDVEPQYLHLHAAAATLDGRVAIVAAPRDTGKSTTVAHLAARGWAFVTDEIVRLSRDTSEVSGYAKPLSVKPGGDELLPHLRPWMIPPLHEDPDTFHFVPVGASGAALAQGGTAHVVILLRRPPAGSPITGPTSRELAPADAVVSLMQETLDAERSGDAAHQLATLAARCHCYELTIGGPEATAELIEKLFQLDPVEPLDVTTLPWSEALAPGVVSLEIGERTVVHQTSSGGIFALDAAATRVWRRLGGWGTEDELDIDGPVIRPFVSQLRGLGVLADSGAINGTDPVTPS